MKKTLLIGLLCMGVCTLSCKKDKDPEPETSETADSRYVGTWQAINSGTFVSFCTTATTITRTYEFKSDFSFSFNYAEVSTSASCPVDLSSSQSGTFKLVDATSAQQSEWSAEFPDDAVNLVHQITLSTEGEPNQVYFIDFRESNGKFRLYWEEESDKNWREYTKQ